ncbi:uncharacterized protein LOC123542423 [Mercenaria mercenaria]|uniref:uncharacterized protein LOC123542423 n=1 Tax=Mercenaria mercenaria TaxID=6596 RepID=UPI00234E8C13|nr:uncharacterized protein LOC123542423 [Mercenaria mercenaria]
MTTTTILLSVCYFALTSVHGIRGDIYCLQCSDVASARDCYQVKKCGPQQVCYSTMVVSASGRISRKMGCRDRVQCSKTIVGKRSPSRSVGDTPICDECCDTNICQPKLCQDKDYATDRGQMCFKCHVRAKNDPCLQITECARDEVCSTTHKIMASGSRGIQQGCFGKHVCAVVSTASNFHRTNDTCFKCCDTDLCNTDCGNNSASSIHVAGAGATTQTSASHCVDKTNQATCKLASSIVCQDRIHAQNADCKHYCGFC